MKKLYLILIVLISSCVDTFEPNLKKYQNLLVVDALITNENADYTVLLSRTFQTQDSTPKPVTKALVQVSDDLNNIYLFAEVSAGVYKSNKQDFVGKVGRKYQLHIKTFEGTEYVSDVCEMIQVPEIENIRYGLDKGLVANDSIEKQGVRFYIDTEDKTNSCTFYRWEFDEAWIFKVPYPVMVQVLEDDVLVNIAHPTNHYCWKFGESKNINIHSTQNYNSAKISNLPIYFAAPELSDRFNIKYSIRIKQYSLSQAEYLFWNNLSTSTENNDDIFQNQPFPLVSNIRNSTNNTEAVLGYFQVSAMTEKRIFVKNSAVRDLGLRNFGNYFDNCMILDTARMDFTALNQEFRRFGLVAFEPLTTMMSMMPIGLRFAYPRCTDCSLSGDPKKPDFWED